MAALFYTNHRMKDVTSLFSEWRKLAIHFQKQGEEAAMKRQVQHSIESPPDLKNHRSPNDDDDMNSNHVVNVDHDFNSDSYNQNPNARFSIDPDEKGIAAAMKNEDHREHIDLSSQFDDSDGNRGGSGGRGKSNSNALEDTDAKVDKAAKRFIDALRKVGPHSKHILNYSYPPLLYQRGDDEEEDEEVSED